MAKQSAKGANRTDKTEVSGGRGKNGRFVAGNKLGVGRPKEYRDFKLRCQEFMDEEGWKELMDLARLRGRSQIHALELIAAYGYGRPPQEMKLGGDGPIPILVTYVNRQNRVDGPAPGADTKTT